MQKEILSVEGVFPTQEEYQSELEVFVELLQKYAESPPDEELTYAVQYFFDKWAEEDIDMDYVFGMGRHFAEYREEVATQVDKYAKSFGYDKMSIIDQTIFLLGYTEWKVFDTPKEVLLNELIELSKRYSDEGTAKLVNGIMHHVLMGK